MASIHKYLSLVILRPGWSSHLAINGELAMYLINASSSENQILALVYLPQPPWIIIYSLSAFIVKPWQVALRFWSQQTPWIVPLHSLLPPSVPTPKPDSWIWVFDVCLIQPCILRFGHPKQLADARWLLLLWFFRPFSLPRLLNTFFSVSPNLHFV